LDGILVLDGLNSGVSGVLNDAVQRVGGDNGDIGFSQPGLQLMAGDYYVSVFNRVRHYNTVKPHLEGVRRGEGSEGLYRLLVESAGLKDERAIRALEVAAIFHAKIALGVKPFEDEFDLLLDVGGLLFETYCKVPSAPFVDLTTTRLLALLSAKSTAWAELNPASSPWPEDQDFEACVGPYGRILDVSRLYPAVQSVVVPPDHWRTSMELDLLGEAFGHIERNNDLGLAFSVEW
jgi:hypothetical protein